jgi:hypothetical protein
MGAKNISSYLQVILTGVVLLAAAMLVILQWGNATDVTMYGPLVKVNTAVLMLCSAGAGIVLLWMVKVFFRGAGTLRRARKAAAAAAPPKPAPAPTTPPTSGPAE